MTNTTTTIKRPRIVRLRNQGSLLRGIVRAFGYLSASERRWAIALFGSTLINAILGLVGLASVLPFFQLLVKPDPLALDSAVGRTFHLLGVASELHAIMLAGAALIGLMVAKNVFGILHTRISGHFCARVETRLATETLQRVVRAPFSWYLQQNSSILRDVIMNHVVEWARGVIRPTLNLANAGLMLFTGLGLLVPFTPIPALIVALLVFGVGGGLLMLARPKIALAVGRKRHNHLVAGIAATEAIAGGREVRMSRAGTVLLEEFQRNYSIYAHSDANSRQWQLIPRYGIEIIGVSAIVVIAIGTLLSGINRFETASILALYAVVAVRLIPIIGEATNAVSTIQISLPALVHLDSLKDELPPFQTKLSRLALVAGWSRLMLVDVSYRYEQGAPDVLSDVNLVIERGRSYGLVGSSGAGKSTLADVIAGLLMVTQGRVLVDGQPIADENALADWRAHVSYVAQSPLIFDASLADNIVLGSAAEDRGQKLAAAIDAAGLATVVAGLDKKENTPIGDRGTRLSGGQRQRVAIARAIYQDADLLVLDEATSALDSLTEREVANALDALKGRMTILAIAHRLPTVMRCDEIIVLDRGRIVARGSHSELMESSEEYQRVVKAQSVHSHIGT
jgi:ABC-type bacteriocin/lantibiotic exporter with double-glycine peptidase domain